MERIKKLHPVAFLFDLDGTLIDSEMLWSRAIVSWLAAKGVQADLNHAAALVFGHSWIDIHASLRECFPSIPARSVYEDGLELRDHYNRVASDLTSIVIPSAVEFYKEAAKIAPCAIVSGSPHGDVETAVKICGIEAETAFVLGMEDYARGKPAPDGYLAAAKRLGADPSRCIVVEDSSAGVKSGIAAGMVVIGIDRNRVVRQNLSGCTITVSDLSEFTRK